MNACGDSRLRGLRSRKPIGFRQWVVHPRETVKWRAIFLRKADRRQKDHVSIPPKSRRNMKPRTELSMELYEELKRIGYPEELCDLISKNLNTDFTARRMLGYLSYYDQPKVEDLVDEMLAILSDRNRIMQKKEAIAANARWNELRAQDVFGEEEDE